MPILLLSFHFLQNSRAEKRDSDSSFLTEKERGWPSMRRKFLCNKRMGWKIWRKSAISLQLGKWWIRMRDLERLWLEIEQYTFTKLSFYFWRLTYTSVKLYDLYQCYCRPSGGEEYCNLLTQLGERHPTIFWLNWDVEYQSFEVHQCCQHI